MAWDGMGSGYLAAKGCVFCRVGESGLANWVTVVFRKFFGQANGAKGKPAPAQQTKLSFSTKASGKKDGETAAEVKEEVEEVVKEEVEEEKGM